MANITIKDYKVGKPSSSPVTESLTLTTLNATSWITN